MRKARAEHRGWKSDELECLPCCASGVTHSLQRRHESNIPQHAPVRQESAVLLYVAYLSSQQDGRLGANVFLANADFAALRLDQAVETTQECGFAGPAFSYKSHGLARWNVDAHIVEREHTSEVMRDIPRS